MTNTEFLTAIIYTNGIHEEVREFAKQELAKLKANTTSTTTKAQQENEKLKQQILYEMIEGRQYTITELQGSLDCCEWITNQKLSALMRQLVTEGKVIRKERNTLLHGTIAVFVLA